MPESARDDSNVRNKASSHNESGNVIFMGLQRQ